jgi:Bacterial RNA polymerase, alpha chain C terminal domain
VISRYVLWDSWTPSLILPEESSGAVREVFDPSTEGAPQPGWFSETTRLAIRHHLSVTGTGAEVVLSLQDGRPTLGVAPPVTIDDMGLSVRSHHCLKAASITTLAELLECKPEQLMALPNFGQKCLDEIADILHRLSSPSFGDEEITPVVIQKMLQAPSETIDDMGFSVRSYNCLKAASITTLAELLEWKPEQLMALPNFGQKCLSEITDIVRNFAYTTFGDTEATRVGTEAMLRSKDGAPMACLLQVRELVPEGALAERFAAYGWHSLAELAVHSAGDLVRIAGMTTEEKVALEAALRAVCVELPLELPAWFLNHIDVLRDAFRVELEQLARQSSCADGEDSSRLPMLSTSLNEELERLIPKQYGPRKRKIVSDFFGFGSKDPMTLDQAAKAQTPKLTRERVRQVARPITEVLSARGKDLPWLSKAIASLKSLAPCGLLQAEQALIDEKILEAPMTVASILRIASRSYIEHGLLIDGEVLLDTNTSGLVDSVMRSAGKLSSRWGVADWLEIELLVPAAMNTAVKSQLREVVWLDAEKRYFVVSGRENSLANRLARILMVTPRLKVAEAYQGVFRDARMEQDRLPANLFGAFCDVWAWCFVCMDHVVARKGLPPSEASGDDLLVLLLREIDRPVMRRELMKRALEHGLTPEIVTHALTYSNVISSANGYFAVIGDVRLEGFKGSEASAPAEILQPTINIEGGGFVPDGGAGAFVGRLMLAVQERVASLKLTAPWSMSELRLNQTDRERLLAWGQQAEWDFRADFGNYETKGGEKVRKRTALGLAFVLFASEAVRRFGGSASIWPAIEMAMGESQQKLFMVRAGTPKLTVRDGVESACRTFGLRHGFEDVSHEVWVRTAGLQLGLQCYQLRRLGAMLAEPANEQPLSIQLLLDTEGPNASSTFRASWKLLQDTRSGIATPEVALERFTADSWLSPFPADELLAQCLGARSMYGGAAEETLAKQNEPYQYFASPVLRWESGEAYLEYSLNELAPPWRESAALILFCDDPFRKERVAIENDRWQLAGGPVRVPLSQRVDAGFRFKLMQGKEEVFADWMYSGPPSGTPFTFFRATGVMVPVADDVPVGEEVVLLHDSQVRVVGLEASPVFRVVLRGGYILTRLPAGAVVHVQLVDATGGMLWSLPVVDKTMLDEAELSVLVRGGKWGAAVDVTLPDVPFTAERLRLNSGEVLPIALWNARATVKMSPGLAGARVALLQGAVGTHRRSARVKLQHLGADFGAALEANGQWQPLDGSSTLDAATLRTQRMLARIKVPLEANQDVCWMEGSRTLAALRTFGASMVGVHGLGESLTVVRGTYNSSQIEVNAARSLTDGGFWRSVHLDLDGNWSAELPFEGPLEDGHSLWMWTGHSPLPRKLHRDHMEKTGFSLRWRSNADKPTFGWAFSFEGTRIGSVLQPETMYELTSQLDGVPWTEAAMWLRWWHAPVLHHEVRSVFAGRVRKQPIETLKAWLLPAPDSLGLTFDELRDEAWAAAAREFLWSWRPDPQQSVDIVKATGIWTGDVERDSQQPPSIETVGLLAQTSPILLVDAIKQALPTMYPYPKPQLAVLLGMVLEAINPNAVAAGFRPDDLCERYAKGESRLDGRFIMTRLVGAARSLLRGEQLDTHNLKIAFHQAGLRELISTVLLRDVFEEWQRGTEY